MCFPIMNVATTQRHGIYVNIPMNVFCNKNALMVQRRRFYVNIPMNTSTIVDVITTQRRFFMPIF